jgi:hypothetical protein
MEIVFDRCAGIDVLKRTVVVRRLKRDASGARQVETQTVATTTDELLRLLDWLAEGGCTHVGPASTSEFWKPDFHLLEGAFEVWLLTAAHSNAVPRDASKMRRGSLTSYVMACCGPALSRIGHNASCAS